MTLGIQHPRAPGIIVKKLLMLLMLPCAVNQPKKKPREKSLPKYADHLEVYENKEYRFETNQMRKKTKVKVSLGRNLVAP